MHNSPWGQTWLYEVVSTECKKESVRGNVIKKSSIKMEKVMELGENI